MDRSPSTTTIGTFLISVVAAYPSIVNCRMGATMIKRKSWGERRSSMNSFRISAAMRRLIGGPA